MKVVGDSGGWRKPSVSVSRCCGKAVRNEEEDGREEAQKEETGTGGCQAGDSPKANGRQGTLTKGQEAGCIRQTA